MKRLLDKKKVNRNGYDDEAIARNILYKEAEFMDFLESQDPFEYLTKFYKVITTFFLTLSDEPRPQS